MRNKYLIKENGTIEVELNRRDGSKLKTLIDNDSLKMIEEADLRLYATYDPKMDGFYVIANTRGGKDKLVKHKLHRFLTKAEKGFVVDHINGDTLDNRISNIRVVTQKINQQNRMKAKNNTSGYRNVRYRKESNKYQAYILIDGIFTSLGSHHTAKEASVVAEKARAKYYEGDVKR